MSQTGLVAFRAWTISERGLSAAHIKDASWPIGLARATCRAGEPPHRGIPHDPAEVAVADCSCGWYAWHEPSRALELAADGGGPRPDRVAGVVQVCGRVQIHAAGLRAERAQIRALAMPHLADARTRDLVHRIAREHGAVVCPSAAGALRAVATEWGGPVDPVLDVPFRPLWVLGAAATWGLWGTWVQRDRPAWVSDAAFAFGERWTAGPSGRGARRGGALLAVVKSLCDVLGVPAAGVPRLKLPALEWLLGLTSLRDLGATGPGPLTVDVVPEVQFRGRSWRELLSDAQADALAWDTLRVGGPDALNELIDACGDELAFDAHSAAVLLDDGATHHSLPRALMHHRHPDLARHIDRLVDRADRLPVETLASLIDRLGRDHPAVDVLGGQLLQRHDLDRSRRDVDGAVLACARRLDPRVWAGLRDRIIADPDYPLQAAAMVLGTRPDETVAAWALDRIRRCGDWPVDARMLAPLANPSDLSAYAIERLEAGVQDSGWWAPHVLPFDPAWLDALDRAPADPAARWAWRVLACCLHDPGIPTERVAEILRHPDCPVGDISALRTPGGARMWQRFDDRTLTAVWTHPRVRRLVAHGLLTAMGPDVARPLALAALRATGIPDPRDGDWLRATAAFAWLDPDEETVGVACRLLLQMTGADRPTGPTHATAVLAALRHLPEDQPIVRQIADAQRRGEPTWPAWLHRRTPDLPGDSLLTHWRLGGTT